MGPAAIIFIGLRKHEGSLLTLPDGEWCTFSGRSYFRCPECGGLYHVPIALVDAEGNAGFGQQDGPFFFCQTPACGFVRGVRFEGWAPPQPFDVSDA